jgi:hypothetical protein
LAELQLVRRTESAAAWFCRLLLELRTPRGSAKDGMPLPAVPAAARSCSGGGRHDVMRIDVDLTNAEHFALFLALGAWAGKLDKEQRELSESYWTLLTKLAQASDRAQNQST